ncbi:MAG TPA: DUF362 domain-containing protein [Verrucomicrobiota bacterium]|nr:DUF362 domain-containing protein [Verrucomicrobiota bacterium]HNU52817.1 DUF362 domain-containing protein [Verrucomicrobiota bacterium]
MKSCFGSRACARGWRLGGWLCLVAALAAGLRLQAADPTNALPPLRGLLVPQARVVVVEDPAATAEFSPQPRVLRRMVERGLTQLTSKATERDAWATLVSTQDVVGIKVLASPGGGSGTRPAVVEALVESLLEAGLSPRQIVVWDKHLDVLRQAGFGAVAERHGVRLEGCVERGYDPEVFYESAFIGQPVWGDHEFGQQGPGVGRKSYVSTLVTRELTKIINVTPLLNHNLAGVSGNLYSLALGAVDNTVRFLNHKSQMALAVPEIYALPELGDRVALNVVDALLAQYYGEERSLLHYTSVLNQLRFGTDPVALDVLSIRELERQRELADVPPLEAPAVLYQNAALVENGVCDPKRIQVELSR